MFYPTHLYGNTGKIPNTGMVNTILNYKGAYFELIFPDGTSLTVSFGQRVWNELTPHLVSGVISRPLYGVYEDDGLTITVRPPIVVPQTAVDIIYSEDDNRLYYHLGEMFTLNILTGQREVKDLYRYFGDMDRGFVMNEELTTLDQIKTPVFIGKEEKTFPDVIEQRCGLYSKHEINYQAELLNYRPENDRWCHGDVRVGENGTIMIGERMYAIRDGKIVKSNERPVTVNPAYLTFTVTSGDYQKVFALY